MPELFFETQVSELPKPRHRRTLSLMIEKTKSNPKNDINALYFGYNTGQKPSFLPIAKMTWNAQNYYYSYTESFASNLNTVFGLKAMIINPNCGFNQTWVMDEPHNLLLSRIPRRADSLELYELLGLDSSNQDVIAYLARSGGRKIGSKITVFPQVSVDDSGYYCYYFLIQGLATKITDNNETFKTIVDSISTQDSLQIIDLDNKKGISQIYLKDLCIGYCPEYISYLTMTNLKDFVSQDYRLEIVKVNRHDYTYSARVLVCLKLKFKVDPYLTSELLPLNGV
jgi:hypothetical protein